jgi:hypothetical protein
MSKEKFREACRRAAEIGATAILESMEGIREGETKTVSRVYSRWVGAEVARKEVARRRARRTNERRRRELGPEHERWREEARRIWGVNPTLGPWSVAGRVKANLGLRRNERTVYNWILDLAP